MKKWAVVFASSYVLAAVVVLVDPDFAFAQRGVDFTPTFSFLIYASVIVNGLGGAFVLGRWIAKRDLVLGIAVAAPAALLFGFCQFIAIQFWAALVMWYS